MTRWTWLRPIVLIGWLGGLMIGTMGRVQVFQNDAQLWAEAVRQSPRKPRVVLNDGRQHELAGDTAYAEAAYRRVIGLTLFDPAERSAYVRQFSQAAAETNLAHMLMKRGQLASAFVILDGTLAEWPMFPYAHYNKGAIFWAVGACEDARAEYDVAVRIEPTLPLPTTPCVPSSSTP